MTSARKPLSWLSSGFPPVKRGLWALAEVSHLFSRWTPIFPHQPGTDAPTVKSVKGRTSASTGVGTGRGASEACAVPRHSQGPANVDQPPTVSTNDHAVSGPLPRLTSSQPNPYVRRGAQQRPGGPSWRTTGRPSVFKLLGPDPLLGQVGQTGPEPLPCGKQGGAESPAGARVACVHSRAHRTRRSSEGKAERAELGAALQRGPHGAPGGTSNRPLCLYTGSLCHSCPATPAPRLQNSSQGSRLLQEAPLDFSPPGVLTRGSCALCVPSSIFYHMGAPEAKAARETAQHRNPLLANPERPAEVHPATTSQPPKPPEPESGPGGTRVREASWRRSRLPGVAVEPSGEGPRLWNLTFNPRLGTSGAE